MHFGIPAARLFECSLRAGCPTSKESVLLKKVKSKRITRRRFLAAAVLSSPFLAMADAKWLEPEWVKVRRVRLGNSNSKPAHRFVHCTDIHHKGDRAYFKSVVKKINGVSPEFVCFTGDLIEEKAFLVEALEMIGSIKCPVYGVPGNHDYWSKAGFADFGKAFEGTGGRWLIDQQCV